MDLTPASPSHPARAYSPHGGHVSRAPSRARNCTISRLCCRRLRRTACPRDPSQSCRLIPQPCRQCEIHAPAKAPPTRPAVESANQETTVLSRGSGPSLSFGDATMKVKIQPMCQVSEDLRPTRRSPSTELLDAAGNRKSTARGLDLYCNLQSGKCDGATFDLSDLTSTGGINLFTMNTMVNATIEKTFVGGIVVRWGIHASK